MTAAWNARGSRVRMRFPLLVSCVIAGVACVAPARADAPDEVVPLWTAQGWQPVLTSPGGMVPPAQEPSWRTPFFALIEFPVTSEVFVAGPDDSPTLTRFYVGNYPQNDIVRHWVDTQMNHTEEPLATTYGVTWLAADLDLDGREELVLQRGDSGMGGNGCLDILSAPQWVLRTRITLPGMKVVFNAVAVDVDDDHALEIYLTPSDLGGNARAMLVDYDNASGSFVIRSNIVAPASTGGPTAAADFDGDGRMEFLTGSSGGYHVYEYVAGALVDRGLVGLAEPCAWATALRPFPGAQPHAILGYSSFTSGYRYYLMRPTGDNTFTVAQIFQEMTGYAGLHSSFAVDHDHDGLDEFVVSLYPIARFYDWDRATNAFVQIWTLDQTVSGTMLRWGRSDLDRDGVAEWCCVNHNNVFRAYEDQGVSSAIAEATRPDIGAGVIAAPNPFTTETRLLLAAPGADARAVSVLDAEGRALRTWALAGGAALAWDGRDRQGRPLSAGVYYLRVEGASRTQRVVRLE